MAIIGCADEHGSDILAIQHRAIVIGHKDIGTVSLAETARRLRIGIRAGRDPDSLIRSMRVGGKKPSSANADDANADVAAGSSHHGLLFSDNAIPHRTRRIAGPLMQRMVEKMISLTEARQPSASPRQSLMKNLK
jgi:hypothetical protein